MLCVWGCGGGVVEALCMCVCHIEEGRMGVCECLWMNRTGECGEVYTVRVCKDGRRKKSLCPYA